jgi:menaquinone-dependent protoporphyrinogen IX oxidase
MTIKEAIELITTKTGMFIVKRFIHNYRKLGKEQKYYCAGHKKCHKYTFHDRIEFVKGTARMYGFDTAKEVIEFANKLIKDNFKY